MFRSIALSCFCAAAAFALATGSASAGTRVTVPDGTPVSFHVTSAVNSQDNHVGDVVPIETVGDVVVDGWIVVPDQSKGECEIHSLEQSGGHGHPGSIALSCNYVVSADHGRLKLQNTAVTQEGEKKHGIATVAGIFTYGIASNAVHGNEAEINTSRTLTAHIDGTVHVVAQSRGHGDTGTYDK